MRRVKYFGIDFATKITKSLIKKLLVFGLRYRFLLKKLNGI